MRTTGKGTIDGDGVDDALVGGGAPATGAADDGGAGAAATVTSLEAVRDLPRLSCTVSVTLWTPADVNVWVADGPELSTRPSPLKSQASRTTTAFPTTEDVEVNVTGSPAAGAAWLKTKLAVKPAGACADAPATSIGRVSAATIATSAARAHSGSVDLLRRLARSGTSDTAFPLAPMRRHELDFIRRRIA
jgi:hypothetical protein